MSAQGQHDRVHDLDQDEDEQHPVQHVYARRVDSHLVDAGEEIDDAGNEFGRGQRDQYRADDDGHQVLRVLEQPDAPGNAARPGGFLFAVRLFAIRHTSPLSVSEEKRLERAGGVPAGG
jgi:hypothetical protein